MADNDEYVDDNVNNDDGGDNNDYGGDDNANNDDNNDGGDYGGDDNANANNDDGGDDNANANDNDGGDYNENANANDDGGNDEVVEEVKEEPKKEEPKKVEPKKEKPKKKKKKSKKVNGKYTVASAFKAISKDNNPINWYACKLVNPKKSNGKLKFVKCGNGGITELQEYLQPQEDQIVFALLRVNSLDNSNSVRAKFVFFRFLGSKVGVMTKAKLNPQKDTIQNQFPVRHMDVNISEDLKGLEVKQLAKEFLRIGGAHKPDKYDFGGDQIYNCK